MLLRPLPYNLLVYKRALHKVHVQALCTMRGEMIRCTSVRAIIKVVVTELASGSGRFLARCWSSQSRLGRVLIQRGAIRAVIKIVSEGVLDILEKIGHVSLDDLDLLVLSPLHKLDLAVCNDILCYAPC